MQNAAQSYHQVTANELRIIHNPIDVSFPASMARVDIRSDLFSPLHKVLAIEAPGGVEEQFSNPGSAMTQRKVGGIEMRRKASKTTGGRISKTRPAGGSEQRQEQ